MAESDAASYTPSESAFATDTQPVELTGLASELVYWAKESVGNAGGPVQYLDARYPTDSDKKQFADALMTHFPPKETISYQAKGPMPKSEAVDGGQTNQLCLHPSVFAWGGNASVKCKPELYTSLRLLHEYLVSGFLTNTDPLHINELRVSAEQYNLGPHSVGYIKGQARMTTLLCILSQVMETNAVAKMRAELPKLYESSRAIWCLRFHFASKRDELFHNFQASARGSIRKLPNVLQWVASIKNLAITEEAGAANLIKQWNLTASRFAQLSGSKSMGVKHVLALPQQIYNILEHHVSQYGWDGCVLSDDVFTSKKITPGSNYRSTIKEWTARGKVTTQSVMLCFQHIIGEYNKTPKHMRQKCSKSTMEQKLHVASVLHALAAELKSQCPVPPEEIEDLMMRWVDGGAAELEMEILEAIREKKSDFTCTEVKAFNEVKQNHLKNSPVPPEGDTTLTMDTVENNSYDLLLRHQLGQTENRSPGC